MALMKLSPPAMIVDLWIKGSRLRRGRDHFGAPCACQPDIGLGGKGRPIPAYGGAEPSTMPASWACSLVRRRISRVNRPLPAYALDPSRRGAVLRRMRRMSASVAPNPCKPCPTRIPPRGQGYGTVAQRIPRRAENARLEEEAAARRTTEARIAELEARLGRAL